MQWFQLNICLFFVDFYIRICENCLEAVRNVRMCGCLGACLIWQLVNGTDHQLATHWFTQNVWSLI